MYDLFVNGNASKPIIDIEQQDLEHKTLLHYAVAGNLSTSRYDFSKVLGK